jgi:hypothetical protein
MERLHPALAPPSPRPLSYLGAQHLVEVAVGRAEVRPTHRLPDVQFEHFATNGGKLLAGRRGVIDQEASHHAPRRVPPPSCSGANTSNVPPSAA